MKHLVLLASIFCLFGCQSSNEPFGGKRAAVFFWSTDPDPAHYPITILLDEHVLGSISVPAAVQVNCEVAYDSGYQLVRTPEWLFRDYLPMGTYIFSAKLGVAGPTISWPEQAINIDYGQCFQVTP